MNSTFRGNWQDCLTRSIWQILPSCLMNKLSERKSQIIWLFPSPIFQLLELSSEGCLSCATKNFALIVWMFKGTLRVNTEQIMFHATFIAIFWWHYGKKSYLRYYASYARCCSMACIIIIIVIIICGVENDCKTSCCSHCWRLHPGLSKRWRVAGMMRKVMGIF